MSGRDDNQDVRTIQGILGVDQDGVWGPVTQRAFEGWLNRVTCQRWREVKASSFADPADVEAFRRCKARGGSDQECFKVGDNGKGCWGDDTTADKPMCALPREDWYAFGTHARGREVVVEANGRTLVCELRDTMPSRKIIRNGCGIDLNPAACKGLGLKPPMIVAARWRWR